MHEKRVTGVRRRVANQRNPRPRLGGMATRSRANPGGNSERPDHPGPGRPAAARQEAAVVQGAGARQPEVPPAEEPDRDREPPHGLPGGRLPEHRRVLAARHRHVHDPRRHLHPPLRLLQRQDRQADVERPARARPRGAVGGQDGPQARGDHERRPRRPPGLRSASVRRRHQTDQTTGAELQSRSPDPRLPRRGDAARQGDRRTTRRVQPQRRGRPPPLPAGAAGFEPSTGRAASSGTPRRSAATT